MAAEIGIRSSSCLNKDGVFTKEQLSIIRNAGFNIVELSFNNPHTGLDCNDNALMSGLKKEAESLSMRLTAHALRDFSLTLVEKTEDERIIKIYRERILAIAEAGINSIVLHPCSVTQAPVLQDALEIQIQNFTARLEKIMPVCEKNRVTLLLETMSPGRVASRMGNLIRVVDHIGSPFLKICLDTNHLNLSEDICAATEKAGKRIGEFHLNDNHKGVEEEHLLPYSGEIDWDAFLTTLCRFAPDVDMILEPSWLQDGKPYEPEDTGLMLKQSREVADRLLSEIESKQKKT